MWVHEDEREIIFEIIDLLEECNDEICKKVRILRELLSM